MPSDFHKNEVLALYGAPNPPQIYKSAILNWWRHHDFFYIQYDFIINLNNLWKFQVNIFFLSKVVSILNLDHFVLEKVENSHLVLTHWA